MVIKKVPISYYSDGLINRQVVADGMYDHLDIKAVTFVGSTLVAKLVCAQSRA